MLPALTLVQRYFDKRRALAAGIACSGFCFGSMLLPPIMDLILQLYGWRGTLIMFSGVTLQAIVAAALFREPPLKVSQKPEISHVTQSAETRSETTIKSRMRKLTKNCLFFNLLFNLLSLGTFLMSFGLLTFLS